MLIQAQCISATYQWISLRLVKDQSRRSALATTLRLRVVDMIGSKRYPTTRECTDEKTNKSDEEEQTALRNI